MDGHGYYRSVTCLPASASRARRSRVRQRRVVGQCLVQPLRERRRRRGPLLGVLLAVEVPDRHDEPVRPERPDVAAALAQLQPAGGLQPGQRRDQPLLGLGAHPAQVRLRPGVDPVGRAHAVGDHRLGRHDHRVRPLQGGRHLGRRRRGVLRGQPPGEVGVEREVQGRVDVDEVLQADRVAPGRRDDRQRRARLGLTGPAQRPRDVRGQVARAGLHLHAEQDLAVRPDERGGRSGQHRRDRGRLPVAGRQRRRRRRQELAHRDQLALGGQAGERAGDDHVVAGAVAGLVALARTARAGAAGVLTGGRVCRGGAASLLGHRRKTVAPCVTRPPHGQPRARP